MEDLGRTPWKAGAATTVITPAESMWLAGWASRSEPSRGTLSELSAAALALEDGRGSRLVLLAVDLIAVSRAIAAEVAGRARLRWGLPRDRLLICASHTHHGPEVRPDKVPFFRIPPEYARRIAPYVDWLVSRLVEVIGAALDALEPARLAAGLAAASFAHNRRGDALADRDVPVLAVTAADGSRRRRALVFGYACHNTTPPPDDVRYCADYAGFARTALASRDPDIVSLFLAGAGADLDPAPRGSVELARRHGEALAEAVWRSLTTPGALREVAGPLRVAYDEVPLDLGPLPSLEALQADATSDDLPARTKAEFLLGRFGRGEPLERSYPCPIHVARLGDGPLLVALGGEPVVDYAHEIRRRHAGDAGLVWVAGYANDMFGYVPTARVLREGGYEGTRSVLWSALPAPFAASTELCVLGLVDRLVRRVREE
jgi:hypothetical protein